jgi:hypothetical protein
MIPNGPRILASVAKPPSPAKPGTPLPKTVETSPPEASAINKTLDAKAVSPSKPNRKQDMRKRET